VSQGPRCGRAPMGGQAIATGTLTVDAMNNGPATTRAFVPATTSPAPVVEAAPQSPRLKRLARRAATRDRGLSSSSWRGRSRHGGADETGNADEQPAQSPRSLAPRSAEFFCPSARPSSGVWQWQPQPPNWRQREQSEGKGTAAGWGDPRDAAPHGPGRHTKAGSILYTPWVNKMSVGEDRARPCLFPGIGRAAHSSGIKG
jgi:hypothetical protein